MSNLLPGIGANGVTSTTSGVTSGAGAAGGGDFYQTLDGLMNEVGGMQLDAESQVNDLLQGNGQDIHSAMIAVQKADLSFQLMMQVRNKIIQAYQTVSQMQF